MSEHQNSRENITASVDSGVISSFQFLNYKVDSFSFDNKKKEVGEILHYFTGDENWSASIGIRQPTLYKKSLSFIGGMQLTLLQHDKDMQDEKNKTEDNAIMVLKCTIIGLFKILDSSDFEKNKRVYEDLGRYQIPAILSPYLRATVTSYFGNAGYGGFVFPLINFTKLAYEQKVELEVIENK